MFFKKKIVILRIMFRYRGKIFFNMLCLFFYFQHVSLLEEKKKHVFWTSFFVLSKNVHGHVFLFFFQPCFGVRG